MGCFFPPLPTNQGISKKEHGAQRCKRHMMYRSVVQTSGLDMSNIFMNSHYLELPIQDYIHLLF